MGGMPVSLIVAEKPSVARDIAKALGVRGRREGYFEDEGLRVTWCVGHLVELAEPDRYDPAWGSWRADTLPMLPERFQLQVREGGEDQFKVVKALMRASDVGELVNACDAGREGELIFAYALQLAGAKAPVKRLWISSMTEAAIREGFRRLRPGAAFRPLEDAARCRSEADWLVGLNATRAMTLRARDGGGGALLSLGRVQTPVLALIVGREQEIEGFEPQDFWQVKVTLAFAAGPLPLLWTSREDGKPTVDRLWAEDEARALLAKVKGQPGLVTRVERREKAEPPPLLYDLTTLQREANRRFGLSAQQTLDTLQALYERHKVLTYPRTDSRHIGAALVPTLPGLVESLRFGPYQLVAEEILARWPVPLDKRVVDDEEVSDHHAILPTGVDPREAPLTPTEKRLYDLVARRLLAVLSPPARFALAEVQVDVAGEPFEAKGRVRLEAGWQRIDPPMTTRGDELLPTVSEGERGQPVTAELHQGQTRPPKPYNEAAILGAMERAGEGLEEAELRRVMKRGGLGTPATRAAILETLLRRGYIHRVERELRPTPQGRALIEALPVEELRSARLTGQWEARLAAMAEGEGGRDQFMQDLRAFTAQLVGRILSASLSAGVLRALAPPEEAGGGGGELLGACPLCQGEVRLRGRGWRCGGCALFIPQTVADREVSQRMAKALLKERRTAPVKGFKAKTGKAFTAALALDDEGKVRFEFPEPEALGACPLCQKPVRDRGKVYSCDTGRECSFVVFKEMSGHSVTEDEARALLSVGRTGLITTLKDRDGKVYSGVLRFDGQKVRAAPMDERELTPPFPCGRCVVGEIRFERNKWRCSHCTLKVPGEVAHRALRRDEVERLAREGRLPKLHGMRQANGAAFKAGLILEESGTVQLDYHAPDEPLPPDGPPPAFGERVDCPACVAKGALEPGYVVLGREAYGCSRWRQGCGMRLPLLIEGLRLPQDEARRFFSRHKETTLLKGFTGAKAAGRPCRVSFVAESPPHWTLTPKSR